MALKNNFYDEIFEEEKKWIDLINSNLLNSIYFKHELKPYTTTTTIITTTNTLNVALTKADVWIVDYTQEFELQSPETTTNGSSKDFEDEEYPAEDSPNNQDSVDTMGFAESFRQTKQNEYKQTYTDVQTSVTNLLSKY